MDLNARPILVFWETTRACDLACRHCRAEALPHPLPGELTTEEGLRLIDSLQRFGTPAPILILTGGDVLRRSDIFLLAEHATRLGIRVGMAPSVTPLLNVGAIRRMEDAGVSSVSVSLDGDNAVTHERIRGVPGHFAATTDAINALVESRMTVQVNTAVMAETVEALPGITRILRDHQVRIWEVFFLIEVGRGRGLTELPASECEDVAHWLVDAGARGLTVRTVEAPWVRRVASERTRYPGPPAEVGDLYRKLADRLNLLLGPAPATQSRMATTGTRDGHGVIFVAYDGTVYPSGFLPVPIGHVRKESLVDIYQEAPLLKAIRYADFRGPCGTCPDREGCGGSRARAWQHTGDPLASDPACIRVAG